MSQGKDGGNTKSKIIEGLKTVFYITFAAAVLVWAGLIFWRLGVVRSVIILALIGLAVTALHISIKRDEKRQKEYQERCLSEITIEDEVFGALKFTKDSKNNEVVCRNPGISFGKSHPAFRITGYEEENKALYFRSLEYVCSIEAEILETFSQILLEGYPDLAQVDAGVLQSALTVEYIDMEKCGEYMLEDQNIWAGDDSFGVNPEDWVVIVEGIQDKDKLPNGYRASPAAYINCRTKQICYVLE